MNPLIGLAVKLSDLCHCGHDIARIGPPAGPHLAELRCTMCQQHRGWLPRTAHQFLIEITKQFGRPTEPVTVRRGGDQCAPPTPQAECAANPAAIEPEGNLQMATKSEIFQTKYLSAPDLKKPIVVEIEAVNVEQLKSREGVTSTKPVLYFRGEESVCL
jgi:hypothetical protein